MEKELQTAELRVTKAWPRFMSWVGSTSALIGLFASIAGGLTWFIAHHKKQTERQSKMALAEAQARQGEYQASIKSYAEILSADALYRPALDQELNAAMRWAEDFHVLTRADQNSAELAAPALDQIFAILNAGLIRSKGSEAADVQAHIGWAHWLNEHIAYRESGSVAEQNFRAALASDPQNVYANAMLGNWMLQKNRSLNEAIQHLNVAISTGKARPFVRSLQFDGLVNFDRKGARAEVIRTANDMRKNDEILNEEYKSRILSFCFSPVVTDHEELAESLSAVPADEVWKTYLWLDDKARDGQDQPVVHDFVYASLLELSGKQQESLEKFRLLQRELKGQPGSLKNSVDAAIARLAHS
jgi:tetratricopeptide (TPR) repeat protein